MKQFLMYASFLFLFNFEAHAFKLFLLSNHENAGDHNQALGIKEALVTLDPREITVEDVNTKSTNALDIRNKIIAALQQGKVIVIGIGEGGIDGIKELPTNPSLLICLTSHMVLERYKSSTLLSKVNFIALPAHASFMGIFLGQ